MIIFGGGRGVGVGVESVFSPVRCEDTSSIVRKEMIWVELGDALVTPQCPGHTTTPQNPIHKGQSKMYFLGGSGLSESVFAYLSL